VYSFYLPFLYSCVSIVGVLLLLVCTPFGFVRLFTLVGEFVTRPQFLRDLDEEHNVARYISCASSPWWESLSRGPSSSAIWMRSTISKK
jgi:hypothetical protein